MSGGKLIHVDFALQRATRDAADGVSVQIFERERDRERERERRRRSFSAWVCRRYERVQNSLGSPTHGLEPKQPQNT